MKIDSISIKNYKSIKEIDNLHLTNLNILIGSNGAGKSNFISFFKMLNKIIQQKLQDYIKEQNGADDILHFGLKVSDEISAKVNFQNNSYRFVLKPTQGDTLYFSEEATPYIGENIIGRSNYETHLFSTKGSKIRGEGYKGVSDHVIDAMESWRVYHFHDTSSTAKVKGSCVISSSANKQLLPNAENLSAFLYYLKLKFPKSFFMIEETIKLIAPYFDRFVLEPDIFDEDKIKLEWQEVGNDKLFTAHHLSDGTLRMICLTTLLLQPNPPDTIIIDEPELGLHPYAITVLASLMKSFATDKQLIVSTQSVTLINHFEPQDIIVADKEKGASTFRRLDDNELKDWIEDYSLGEIWEKNIIGGRP
jgi:predicted ATPase